MPRHKADTDAPPDHPTKHWNPPVTAVPNAAPERLPPKPRVHWNGPPAVIQASKGEQAPEAATD